MPPLQPTDFFVTALELMAGGGAGRVTIEAVCDALQVTKGSFYHHFNGRQDFVRQTLLYWERVHGQSLAAEARTVPDARERIAVLAQLAVGLNHDAERAIRDLASTDTFAHDVLRRVDHERWTVVAQTYEEAGLPATEAGDLADVGLSILVGAQETRTPTDRERVAVLLGCYRGWVESVVAGQPAPSSSS